ncbi:MAG: hypothetical protein ACOY4W_04760 [Thermodesulfobacteriota bacterium]
MRRFKRVLGAVILAGMVATLLLAIYALCQAASAKFGWSQNTETNLAGYKIYYGMASRDYTTFVDVGNPAAVNGQVTATLSGFTAGETYYFAATAYDTNSYESDYSNEVVWTVPLVNPDLPTPIIFNINLGRE